jgi:hypothetical protein
VTDGIKDWGRWATLGLALIAMLVGQMAALTALMWWRGLSLSQMPDVAADGVTVIVIICVSNPVQVMLLALMARQTGASAADYLGLRLPRKTEIVGGIIAIVIYIVVSDGNYLVNRPRYRQPISARHLSDGERGGLSAVAMAHCSRGGADWRGNDVSRLFVSRLAPRSPRCLACDHRDRAALGPKSSAIRCFFHGPSVFERAGARMVSVEDGLHHPEHAAARPAQL